ncbi:MAG: hypothetical protein E7428_05480 [Ruminococcaceae bacterium]|nr:hypothetical protein [Oscillospiraceae bacterium]
MKVTIVQPAYSTDYSRSEELFAWEMEAFDACDPSMDLIVFPEATDVPALAGTLEEIRYSYDRFFGKLYEKARETAIRCNAIVCFCGHDQDEKGLYNTTFVMDRQGNLAGKYNKQHLTPGEVKKLVCDYTYQATPTTMVEVEGIRFCFLTCYDFYFYEAFPQIARMKPDIIIGCSHQRSDMQSALRTINQFLAYNTNAYVVRSSVSMGEGSIGGGSTVVAPDGTVLCDMESRVGMASVEIDPTKKYYKPAGFGNPLSSHFEYVEKGRRPWKYRPAGPAMVPFDAVMGYPRVCAHRGFNTIAPENSMPAFGAAVDMGAEEIEFDLWWTKDGEIVSIHDDKLDRVSNGTGLVYEHTLAELREYDFGIKHGPEFAGLKILTFEEILKKLTGRTVMNIHLKTTSNTQEYDRDILQKIIDLIDRYDAAKWVYFMSGNDLLLELLGEMAPHIARCVGGGNDAWGMVERAIRLGCPKIQLVKGKFDQAMIDKAHQNGIICNVFWSDDPAETQEYLEMGIDVILTNDYNRIAQVVSEYRKA